MNFIQVVSSLWKDAEPATQYGIVGILMIALLLIIVSLWSM